MPDDGARQGQFFPWITLLADDFNPDQFAVCSISGNNSPNVLNGTAGSDIICGKGGNDSINGHGGNDLVIGDGGDDLLKGGPGTYTCTDPDPGQKATCELP